MSTRRQLIGAGATSLAMAAIAARPLRSLAQDDDDDDGNQSSGTSSPRIVGTPVFRPEIDFVRAQEIALEGNDGAAVTKVELDGDDGLLAYSISLDSGVQVDIDAMSGAVIRTEQSDDDDNGDDNNNQSSGTSTSQSAGDDDDGGDDDSED